MDGKGAWRDNVFVERLWRSVKSPYRRRSAKPALEAGKRVYCHASEEIVALTVPLASVTMRKVVSS
jgi:hypothetical protein